MKTLTVRLSDLLARRIEEEALARRMSKSDIVRERLDQPQPVAGKGGGGMRELIGDLIGSVKDDGLPAEGESLRHILEESWQARVPDQPPRFRSPHKQKIADLIRAKNCVVDGSALAAPLDLREIIRKLRPQKPVSNPPPPSRACAL